MTSSRRRESWGCWRYTEGTMTLIELGARLQTLKDAEQAAGAEMFLGAPDRWYEKPRWRCPNDHVSTAYLKSEAARADLCLACYEPVRLTFPEDRDGPLR